MFTKIMIYVHLQTKIKKQIKFTNLFIFFFFETNRLKSERKWEDNSSYINKQ